MKRVLLTGMSGTGKSAVVRALSARGYKAVDTDDGWCQPAPDGRQLWRADAIETLLATQDADVLFVAGCEENQVQFHPRFDHIILRRILDDLQTVEPLLRRAADHEVRTTMPLTEVVTTILRLVDA